MQAMKIWVRVSTASLIHNLNTRHPADKTCSQVVTVPTYIRRATHMNAKMISSCLKGLYVTLQFKDLRHNMPNKTCYTAVSSVSGALPSAKTTDTSYYRRSHNRHRHLRTRQASAIPYARQRVKAMGQCCSLNHCQSFVLHAKSILVNFVPEILSPYLTYCKIFMLMIIFNVYCLFGCKEFMNC